MLVEPRMSHCPMSPSLWQTVQEICGTVIGTAPCNQQRQLPHGPLPNQAHCNRKLRVMPVLVTHVQAPQTDSSEQFIGARNQQPSHTPKPRLARDAHVPKTLAIVNVQEQKCGSHIHEIQLCITVCAGSLQRIHVGAIAAVGMNLVLRTALERARRMQRIHLGGVAAVDVRLILRTAVERARMMQRIHVGGVAAVGVSLVLRAATKDRVACDTLTH
mmetsp:Transcript_109306/g.308450  ORF Transcript_109306/g.308450 Transcript_109306/m.308450 type:complete len:216 (+) Transcript_109306:1041-1688(+)